MPDLYMLFPEGKAKALTLSYDDGVEQDILLMKIMDQNGLKGTFNLSSGLYPPEDFRWPEGQIHRRMPFSQAKAVYTHSGHEIAIHGYSHGDLAMLPSAAAAVDVMKDKEALERDYDRMVRGMAYAYGRYNDQVVDLLKSCGVAYARTTHASHNFEIPQDWLRLPATCHHKDEKLMDLARQFAEGTPRMRPWLFYLWGHSYEFDMDQNWHVIEEFAAYIGKRDDIWYATNIEIHDYVEAYRSLHCSADGKRIYNPTCHKIWLHHKSSIYAVDPGAEIQLP